MNGLSAITQVKNSTLLCVLPIPARIIISRSCDAVAVIDSGTYSSSSKPIRHLMASDPIELKNERSVHTEDEGFLRYAAYANRIRTILLAAHRYVAYTSDIGESFRPVAHPYLVTFAYGVSGAYLIGDVSYAAWKAKMKSEGRFFSGLKPWDYPYPPPNKAIEEAYRADPVEETDWKSVAVKRGIFHSLASMALPAFTINSAVRYSSLLFKKSKIKIVKTYGPVSVGLGVVPLLPYIFDEPVEKAVEYAFEDGLHLLKDKFQ